MSNSAIISSPAQSFASRLPRSARSAVPAAALAASLLALSGCGGGAYYAATGPCNVYGCGYGYGYGYGAISTLAGSGLSGNTGNGAPAVQARLAQPVALAIDPSGNLFIADRASNAVREVAAATGIIASAAPGNSAAPSGSRTLLASSIASGPRFNHPAAVALDTSGNLYVVDQASSTVSRISATTGTIATIVGGPAAKAGYAGDNGPASAAQLNLPSGIAFDRSGNLYIADTFNHRIRRVSSANGTITTVAGNGTAGFSGDGSLAVNAQLSHPAAIAADSKGNLYIADSANDAIRKVDVSTGLISTVAGNGVAGFSGDNSAATSAQLNEPQGVSVDTAGNLFIADTSNQRIREVAAHTGIITTIAGDQNQGYSGDGGPSSRADLSNPYATAIDATGNLYIADSGNSVIRKVLPNPKTPSAKAQ